MRPIDERLAYTSTEDRLMSLADVAARAQARMSYGDPRRKAKRFAYSQKARKIADLKAAGYVLPLSEWLGHNNGPAWDEELLFREFCWNKAHREAWTPPTQEIGIRRAKKAEALGLTYREYVLEIMERGRYLDEETAAELRKRLGH
jgi:hypothetical protein